MLNYKILIKLFVLNGVFVCCVSGAAVQPEVGCCVCWPHSPYSDLLTQLHYDAVST